MDVQHLPERVLVTTCQADRHRYLKFMGNTKNDIIAFLQLFRGQDSTQRIVYVRISASIIKSGYPHPEVYF